MSDLQNVKIVVEGPTEEIFIKKIVVPYLLLKGIQIMPIVLHGDVTFDRVKGDVIRSLKERKTKAVSCFVDYYGLKDWPEKDSIQAKSTPQQIADTLNQAAKTAICKEAGDELEPGRRGA